jgi:hypothetical protein
MKIFYHFDRPIWCRVPAPSVGFGEGGRMVFAGQFLGKGTSTGDETRRSRKAVSHRLTVDGWRLAVEPVPPDPGFAERKYRLRAIQSPRGTVFPANRQPPTANPLEGPPCPR